MEDDQRLIIAGDSWSQGEFYRFIRKENTQFGDGVTQRSHPGMWHYLFEHFPDSYIANLGISGGHNDNQVRQIKEEIDQINPDAVIFFYTCPSRTLASRMFQGRIPELNFNTLTIDQYEFYCKKFAREIFVDLNSLNVPVLLIGGHVDLPIEQFTDCANLVPLIPSMKNLVDKPLENLNGSFPKSYLDYDNLERTFWVYERSFTKEVNPDLQTYLTLRHEETMCQQRWTKNPKYFPDNGHGGRLLHKLATDIVAQYLKTQLPKKYF